MEDGTELTGEFDGKIDHMNFYLNCPEILRNIDNLKETVVNINFGIRDLYYTFSAEITGISERPRWARETVDMSVIAPIKEIPRRKTFRVEIKMKVNIYSYVDNIEAFYKNQLLCEAVTNDVSKGGVRIWTDYTIDDPLETTFVLEFAHPLRTTHIVTAKLMRSKRNTSTRAYNYDYGFAFDFSKIPEKKDSFIMDVVEAKLRGEGRLL